MDDLTFLASAARDGDRAALERFVRTSQPDVWRLCAYLGDPHRADDLTQDTFVRVIGALPAFRGESAARTWLLSIARRACADEVRRAQRRRKLFTRLAAQHGPEEQPVDHAVDLDDMIRALPATRRDAFVLTQLLGMSYEEAAQICHCPVGTIRSRVSRLGPIWWPRWPFRRNTPTVDRDQATTARCATQAERPDLTGPD